MPVFQGCSRSLPFMCAIFGICQGLEWHSFRKERNTHHLVVVQMLVWLLAAMDALRLSHMEVHRVALVKTSLFC